MLPRGVRASARKNLKKSEIPENIVLFKSENGVL